MKNKYIFLALFAISLLSSCEKESEGLSSVLKFEIVDDETMLVQVGTEFKDPGFKISLDGKDVSSDVKITSDVNSKTVGLYHIAYTYVNDNTGMVTKERTVIVCDPTVKADMSGEYVTTNNTKIGSNSYPGQPITISKIAPGFFHISDFFGGFYATFKGYGRAYACSGYVQLGSDNTIKLLSSSILPWQDTIVGLTDAAYDPETKTVRWKAEYVEGMEFNVELN